MKLIINADDAGIDAARNKGIFKAIDEGVVKSISVIVYQTGWADILDRLIDRKDLCVGVHFNLTAGRPLVENHKTLINERGFFLNKFELFTRAGRGEIDPSETAAEFKEQLEVFTRNTGITPAHYDGHNHIHLLPGAREGFFRVVPKGSWVRLALESGTDFKDLSQEDLLAVHKDPQQLVSYLNFLSAEARKVWGDQFHYPDDFRGTKVTPKPTLKAFKQAVDELHGNICELMCHPGDKADEYSAAFSQLKERQTELKILTSPKLKEYLQKKEIGLGSFKELS
ncbi:MAG TPA: ChbG/HpnK family deacetylase [Candidatus Omnitrophota bacterium]|nr:ChbG/HpnK family deacetylase [Candidatus Omnitrophota bacterium]HPD85603.1 ChbG/HpnK family deacetylase [Candidatus Omnitrophota bacterium]HRZ04531.1 ChbG/HpnK family deacetylase [Candidatus Omnitrophota bacterium]